MDYKEAKRPLSVISVIFRIRYRMGHENSKEKKLEKQTVRGDGAGSSREAEASGVDPRVDEAFRRVSKGDAYIHYKRLVEIFGEDLSESLWGYFTNGKPHTEAMTHEEFARKALSLIGTSTDIYVKICLPVQHLIKVCSDAAGASAVEGDETFIRTLMKDMTRSGDSIDAICEWRRTVCPQFCQAVHSIVGHHFMGYDLPSRDYDSDVLSPLQMWFLQCCLPPEYFPLNEKKEESLSAHWTPLYSSAQHGISASRFETCVFGYKGPTVSIFRLKDGRTVAFAVDQEWRHSGKRFGGPFTGLVQLEPEIKRIDAAAALYCNLKLRTEVQGIAFLDYVKIDKDMIEVLDIETWGCAGAKTLQDQQKLKQWQHAQAERNKKVPLPGNWDDNPDKTIMEMAGFQFSNEKKLMEMEAAANEKKEKCDELSRSMARDPW